MKKTLLTLALTGIAAHAADTPEAAVEQLLQHILDGNGAQAATLTYIAPELNAEGIDSAAIQAQLTQCYNGNARQSALDSGRRLAAARAERNADGSQAQLFATIRDKDGNTFEPEPLTAIHSAQGWQIDFVDAMLGPCPELNVGDPRDVLQRYLDAWQRGDEDAAFALTHITAPAPESHRAEKSEKFSEFYRTHAQRKLRIKDAHVATDSPSAYFTVIDEHTGKEDIISLRKTAHGWRLENW